MKRIAVAALVLAACRPSDPGRDVIARYRRWRGPVERLGVLALSGEVTMETGQKARIELVSRADGAFREVVDLGTVAVTRVVGPDGAYQVGLSGDLEALPEHERAAYLRRIARVLGRGFGGGTYLGRRERDGKRWDVVRADAASELYLDPADGSLGWVRVVDDGETTWERLSDWRVADGVRVAGREESIDEKGRTSGIVWASVRAGQPADPATFARPAPPRRIAFGGGADSTGWMPFQLVNDKILLAGKLDGHDVDVLLDSGAGITVVDGGLAGRLHLGHAGDVDLAGTGARQKAPLVGPAAVELGAMTVSGIIAVAVDLSQVGDVAGKDPPLIVGKEVFQRAVVDIDFPGRRIAFHDRERFHYTGRGVAVPTVADSGGLVSVELSVEGRPPALFGVDTGGAGALDIFAPYAEKTGLLRGRRTSERLGAGVGGEYVEKVGRVREVSLGGQVFRDVPVTFPNVKEGAFATERLAGNLGAALLSRFHVILDFAGAKLYLEAAPDDVARPFARDRSGLQVEPKGDALEVRFVAPGSPAAAAGWKVGERVVSIGGKRIADLDRDAQRAWQRGAPGTKVHLVDGAGRARELVLADYY